MRQKRRLPVGAEVQAEGAHFRVWSPLHRRVEVVLDSGSHDLLAEADGYFAGFVQATAGDRYRYRLDGGDAFPDPVSRYQPEGPHGPSQLIDPSAFQWSDSGWKGVKLAGQIIYEMHIGTFTREGTWVAAARELPELAAAGITVIEVMPVADFAGRFGWGYDGVNMFAPTRLYGTPDDFRRFVDAAHAAGLAVILDVVYNHFGPDGNYLAQFSKSYITNRHGTDWGEALNFDGPGSAPVREFFIANAGYWIDEFHLDGLRLDATQDIHDTSPVHVLTEIGRRVREVAPGRETILVNENEPQWTNMVRPEDRGGYGLDGLWNDDYHHCAMAALTGRNEAYYSDHLGTPQEFISAAKYGYLYQGQRYSWQEMRRGTPTFDVEPWRFINFLQNHDQVANSGRGLRCQQLTSPGRYKAMTALTLLLPGTPMLFQGQEFGASTPFFYFADHVPELAEKVHLGRVEFMKQFRSLDRPDLAAWFPVPSELDTYERSKLNLGERLANAPLYDLHKDLLRLRRTETAFQPRDVRCVDGAVLGTTAFLIRFMVGGRDDRLLLVNLGRDLHLEQIPEPLLAPPVGCRWEIQWSSEDMKYGGNGTPPPEAEDGWRIMGEAAVLLAPEERPWLDHVEAQKAAKERVKERRRRERAKLME